MTTASAPASAPGDRSLVAHIGAEHRHLLDARCMEGNTRTLGIAGYDADGHSFGGETAHETLAENPVPPNTLTAIIGLDPLLTRRATNDTQARSGGPCRFGG